MNLTVPALIALIVLMVFPAYSFAAGEVATSEGIIEHLSSLEPPHELTFFILGGDKNLESLEGRLEPAFLSDYRRGDESLDTPFLNQLRYDAGKEGLSQWGMFTITKSSIDSLLDESLVNYTDNVIGFIFSFFASLVAGFVLLAGIKMFLKEDIRGGLTLVVTYFLWVWFAVFSVNLISLS